jgi:hypothetical protein
MSVWLSVARTPATVLRALTQEFSVFTRTAAIRRLNKLLGGKHFQETWDWIGGAPVLLSVLGKFSVSEIKLCLFGISNHINRSDMEEKQAKFAELLQGLVPHLHPDAPFQSADERAIGHTLQHLLHKKKHYRILRQQCLDKIFKTGDSDIDLQSNFRPLLQRLPALRSNERSFSESMLFSLGVLKRLAAQPGIKVEGHNILRDLIKPLIHRAWKRRIEWTKVREILDLSIKYLSSQRGDELHLTLSQGGLIYFCILFWVSRPAHRLECETRLISILKIVTSSRNLQEFETVMPRVPVSLRYKLLKIYFLNTGSKYVDIDQMDGMADVLNEAWSTTLLIGIDRGHAVELLKRLRNAGINSINVNRRESRNSILSIPANSTMLLNLLDYNRQEALERATCKPTSSLITAV